MLTASAATASGRLDQSCTYISPPILQTLKGPDKYSYQRYKLHEADDYEHGNDSQWLCNGPVLTSVDKI